MSPFIGKDRNIDPEPLATMRNRGGTWAVYQNAAMDSARSWEVDALPPNVLTRIIRASLDKLVDKKMMKKVIEREQQDKARLKEALESLQPED